MDGLSSRRFQSILTSKVINEDDGNDDLRFKNIFGQGVEVDAGFVAPVFPKLAKQEELIISATKNVLLFSDMDEHVMKMVVDAMEPYTAVSGKNIIKQGETGDYFYVVERGTIGFYIDGESKGSAGSGACFGELALMYDCPRAATCKAESSGICELWRVHQSMFKRVLANTKNKQDENALKVIKQVSFLADLDPIYLTQIADALIETSFDKGQTIMKKGDKGDVFYIVKNGSVKLSNIGLGVSKFDDQTLEVGDFFGERALVTGEVRAANATALTDCILLALSAENFELLLGGLDELMEQAECRNLLMSVPMITRSNPSDMELNRLLSEDHLKYISFDAGATIAKEGESHSDPALYLLREGSVSLSIGGEVTKILSKGDYFGDTVIASGIYNYTILSLGNEGEATICKKVELSSIKNILGDKSRLLSVNLTIKRLSLASSRSDIVTPDQDPDAIMINLEKKKILGSGTFGKVWLVKHKLTLEALALKIQKKGEIIKYKQVNGVIREKQIMDEIQHPFIINMVNAFQDSHRLYMVLDMYPGGELYSILHQKNSDGVKKEVAVFYAAVILEALDFMHMKDIIYRDLKPENVLLDSDGYCVIVDMGFAKKVKDKTYTLCGTPLYIAPEVILSKGHNKAADIWSLGVLIFEMIYGFTPFYRDDIDQMGLFRLIVRGDFKFPKLNHNKSTKDIVTRMLNRRPAYRLGCLKNGSQDLRKHKFFSGIDFDKLLKKKINAPWKPKLNNPFDTKHFDDWSHLERDEGRDPVLTAEQQAMFKNFD